MTTARPGGSGPKLKTRCVPILLRLAIASAGPGRTNSEKVALAKVADRLRQEGEGIQHDPYQVPFYSALSV
jgi:hypothetical protein